MIFYCKKRLLLFTKIVIVLLTVEGVFGIDQKISFFASEDCSGKNVSFGDLPTALTDDVKMSKSFLVEYGAWRVYEMNTEKAANSNENKDNNSSAAEPKTKDVKFTPTKIWSAHHEYKICRSKSMTIEKIERIGGRDLEEGSLTLYPEADFIGTPTVVNQTKSFDKAVEFKSWAIAGEQSWMVYNDKDFEGENKCFEASSLKYSVELRNEQQKTQFFSVQKGCNGSCSLKAFSNLLFSSVILQAVSNFI